MSPTAASFFPPHVVSIIASLSEAGLSRLVCLACQRSRHAQVFLFLAQVYVQPPPFPKFDMKETEVENRIYFGMATKAN